MDEADLAGLKNAFQDRADPRSERKQDDPVMSIVMIADGGAISGADNWVEMEADGKAQPRWLETWLD